LHGLALGRTEAGRDPVGDAQHGPHQLAERLGGVGFDPATVERVGRAGPLQLASHLPVDPVAGQQRGQPLVERPAQGHGRQVAGVRQVRRGHRRGRDVRRCEAELAEEAFVEAALDLYCHGGMPVEQKDPVFLGGASRQRRQAAGELAQVESVLDDVEPETLPRQAAVGETDQERMAERGLVDRRDRLPQPVREMHRSTSLACVSKVYTACRRSM
jgi:hypothetical protein